MDAFFSLLRKMYKVYKFYLKFFSLAEESVGGVYGASRFLIAISRALGVLPAEAARVEEVVKEPVQPYRPNRNTRIYRRVLCVFIVIQTFPMN